MSLAKKEMYATRLRLAEQLDIDEIANIIYYQHLQTGMGEESARYAYDTTKSEVIPRWMAVKNMIENQFLIEEQRNEQ